MKIAIIERILAIALLTVTSLVAAANVPKDVGPQGFLIWESPRALPDLSFKDDQGNALNLSNFEGKVVLLNVWATWCGPCREEMPTLDSVQEELGGPDFEVIALSIDRQVEAVDAFFQEIDIKHLRKYIDESTMAGTELGAVGVPTTVLIDRHGEEIGRLVGATEWDSPEMIGFLKRVIKKTD